ncbi:MAG: hypothetical protein A2Y87_04220, partial [Bacteroidetes bacterium RBG_13_46_8]
FNSLAFAIFLPVVFILYWYVVNKNLKIQNILLLLASYFFYGWWDWRFLILLIAISVFNYFTGILIDKDETGKTRGKWLALGLLVNLGMLCVFKYYNFFIDSFIDLVSLFGYNLSRSTTRIILPLGISFYTFLSLSYILDIYKRNLKAHRNILEVLLSLSFFPIILAGPIQRPSTLLPQIARKREFNYPGAGDGLKQILWGLFVKTVIADNLAPSVDTIFKNYADHSGSILLIGAILYAIQIYADFSGYSNIAIGTGKLFGFNLMQNFAYPYFGRDISEFWKRWHISLTTWFRDYLFLPLSVTISRGIKKEKVGFVKADLFIYIVASAVTWFLTGLWHGANYTFIVWGLIHGFFLILYQWQKQPRKKLFKKIGIKNSNSFVVFFETILTVFIVLLAWIFFRSDSIAQSFAYLGKMFSTPVFEIPSGMIIMNLFWVALLLIAEWIQRDKQHALQFGKFPVYARWAVYYALVILIIFMGGKQETFIYFQF